MSLERNSVFDEFGITVAINESSLVSAMPCLWGLCGTCDHVWASKARQLVSILATPPIPSVLKPTSTT